MNSRDLRSSEMFPRDLELNSEVCLSHHDRVDVETTSRKSREERLLKFTALAFLFAGRDEIIISNECKLRDCCNASARLGEMRNEASEKFASLRRIY